MLNLQVKDAVPMSGYAGLMETMGTRIRQLRQAKGYTQAELGKLVRVTKSAVSQWETDMTKDIKLDQFLELCRILGTDPEYVVFGAERQPAPVPPKPVGARKARQ